MRPLTRRQTDLVRAPGRLWRMQEPLAARRGDYLGTRYRDGDVTAMAGEDGQARFGTAAWGPTNRVLHGQWAVVQAAVTHAVAVRLWLDGALSRVAGAHASVMARFRARVARAWASQAAVARAVDRRAELTGRLADRGLDPPTLAWKMMALLGLLGLGDLTMTSVAMMLLNISDRRYVAWLPFSALQVAAVPVVVGLLTAAHFLGESIKAYRCEPRQRPVAMLIGLVSLGAGLSLAVSVASVRSSYLVTAGVPSEFWPFIGIQLGFFAVAVAASAWAAHPYRAAWRQASRELRRAVRRYLAVRRSAARMAGRVNKLVWRHRSLVARAAAGVAAVSSDGARQGRLYLRGHQHGLPGPVIDGLPGQVPEVEMPGPVRELQGYPGVEPDNNLAPLTPVALDDLDRAWVALVQQMQEAETVWRVREPAAPRLGSFPLSGASQQPGTGRGAPARSNGTSRRGAR
jgi:hypothetical protein